MLKGSIKLHVNETTHSYGHPNTIIPSIVDRSFAAFFVAYCIALEFLIYCYKPRWVREYHAPALANPERDPGKEGVA